MHELCDIDSSVFYLLGEEFLHLHHWNTTTPLLPASIDNYHKVAVISGNNDFILKSVWFPSRTLSYSLELRTKRKLIKGTYYSSNLDVWRTCVQSTFKKNSFWCMTALATLSLTNVCDGKVHEIRKIFQADSLNTIKIDHLIIKVYTCIGI